MFLFNDQWYVNHDGKLRPSTEKPAKLNLNVKTSPSLGFDYLLNHKGIYTAEERENHAIR